MRKTQAGQAFILVLIVLAIGAVLVVPSLRLTGTALMGTPIVERQIKGLYAADAAQEYILWKLAYDGLGSQFTVDGQSASFNFDVCGVPVGVTIVMRATEGTGGTILATDDKIKPTKTVDPSWVPGKALYTYTYTIELDHLSDDNSEGLDAICDIPPGEISDYIDDSSYMRIDGGPWLPIPDPDWSNATGLLKWPADYDPDTETGVFSSDPYDPNYFHGMRDFEVRQVKEIKFQMSGRLADNVVHCNWVVLKPWNTMSGPQAPIYVGDASGECLSGGLDITKEVEPEIIPPGEATEVTYTISVTNQSVSTQSIQQVIDYLPPDFNYIANSVDPSSTITTLEPEAPVLEEVNGLWRERVRWTKDQFPGSIDVSIASGETLTLSFQALATKDVSGSYYNEVLVILKDVGIPGSAFDAAGVSAADYASGYSWNTGAVIVPAYDSTSEAEGITINSNMALILGGITITSWQVD